MPNSGVYAHCKAELIQGAFNSGTDTWKCMLVDGYTPNFDTDAFYTDISSDEVSGTGYTAGGETLSSITVGSSGAPIVAASWGLQWAATTAFKLGQIVRLPTSNNYLYKCVVAGTTGGSQPTWPTVPGETVTDSGVTWLCIGTSATPVSAANPSWSSATITATGAVIYKSTGTGSSSRLIAYVDFGGTVTSTAGTFTVTFDANCGFMDLS